MVEFSIGNDGHLFAQHRFGKLRANTEITAQDFTAHVETGEILFASRILNRTAVSKIHGNWLGYAMHSEVADKLVFITAYFL